MYGPSSSKLPKVGRTKLNTDICADGGYCLSAWALTPAYMDVCICRLCPESPRWLVSRERYTEAEAILQKVADINGRELPPKLDLTPDPVSSQFVMSSNTYC